MTQRLSTNPCALRSLFVGFLLFGKAAHASPLPASAPPTQPQSVDLSLIEVTPHELALTQVLAELCPTLLNQEQNKKFAYAHQIQLQSFMPSLNTTLAMRQVSQQPEYKKIIQSVKRWTLSYPKEENKALCIEFAESSF